MTEACVVRHRDKGALRCAVRWTLTAMLALFFSGATATQYWIDPKETRSSFEVWMLGFIPIRGQFKNTTGALIYDAASQTGNIEVSINTTNIEANSERAEAAARSADFFNVDKYPRMNFKSSRFVFEGGRLRAVDGVLTLTGTARPVTLAVSQAACGQAAASEAAVCRAEASVTVKRSAFGMKAWSRTVGDDVTIRLAIVAFAPRDANVTGSDKANSADAEDTITTSKPQ